MTKQEVFDFLATNDVKGCIRGHSYVFKKHFPEIYKDFLKTKFPVNLENCSFKQKLWHFLNDTYTIPICKVCGRPVKFNIWGYNTYCSGKCVMKDDDVKKKVKQTCIKKYGAEHYSKTNEYKSRVKQTNIEKYGCESYSQTDEYKNMMREHNLNTYGVEIYMQSNEFKEKSKQTQLNLYGVENYRQSDEYEKKYKQTCLEKYGTEYSAQSDICKEKVRKTCLEKYGSEYYVKTEEFQQKSQETCQEKYGVNNYSQTDEFKEFFKENCDEFQKRSYNSKKRNHSFNTSSIEEEFSEYLLKSNIKFNRQYKSYEYPFACDFYLSEYKLYIEIQGSWTHGWHPFNENDIEDIKTLQSWKMKNKDYYNVAIDVWTIRDVKKREIAKQNKLNYLEIFSNDINECISQLKQKIESL